MRNNFTTLDIPLFIHKIGAISMRLMLLLGVLFFASGVQAQNYGILKKIFDPDGAAGDNYGWSVGVSDSVAVVGSPQNDIGTAHVYFRNEGGMDNWGFVKQLEIIDGATGDEFGFSVAVSDTIVVVGAPFQDGGGSNRGAAYVFSKNQGGLNNWGQVAKLAPSGVGSQDQFGYAVSISGGVIAVSAKENTEGTVHIFYIDNGGTNMWGEEIVITASDAASGDEFGYSLDMWETTLVVGAPGNDVNGSNDGAAYVFSQDNGGADNWGEVKAILASDGTGGDRFGTDVSVDSATLVVGSPFDDDEGTDSGSGYLYSRDLGGANNWGELTKIVGSSTAAEDEFGHSVSVSRDVLLIGAPQDDDSGASSGTSFLFRQDQGGMNNWGETQRIQAFDASSGNQYGFAVDIEGPFLYVGSPTDDDSGINSGSVYIYRESAIICPDVPTVDCQDVTVYLDGSGIAEVTPGEINSGASASCEFNVTLSQSVFSCDNIGTNTVTLTLVDLVGNQVECQAIVTVVDSIPPSFMTCPVDTLVVSNNADACEGNVIWSIPSAQDNCTIDSIVQTAGPAPGTSIPLGTYDIQYVVYDQQLLTDTCNFVLQIVDTQAPFLACPPSITVENDADQCDWTSAPGQLDPLIAIDNCAPVLTYTITTSTGAVTSDSGRVMTFDFPVGVNTICYMISDSSGTQSDTCCFTVTVEDLQIPDIICPSDNSIGTDDGVCQANYAWNHPSPTDNCAIDSMTMTLMLADGSGIIFTVPPGSYGGQIQTVFPIGTSTVVYVVVDTSGNVNSCFFELTVFDDENPVVTCPADTTVNTSDGGMGDCASTVTITHPMPTDNCQISSYTIQILNPDGSVEGPLEIAGGTMLTRDFDLGVSSISYIVVDGNMNSAVCTYDVTVIDDEMPAFASCPTDTITVGTNVDVCEANVSWATPIAFDNCSVDSVIQISGPLSGESLAPGFYTVVYVAYDGAATPNTDTCTFVIHVIDTQNPTISCPSNEVVVGTDPGNCSWDAPVGSLSPTVASGNCPYAVTWAVFKDDTLQASGTDDVSGNHTFDLGESIVCYYIIETEDPDSNGLNTDTCCFSVVVEDIEAPIITCPPNTTFQDTDDMSEDCQHLMGSTALDATATDNCSVISVTHDYNSPDNTTLVGAIWPVGVSTITWTAVDTAGNISTCSYTVTVVDNVDPFIPCPADTNIVTSDGGLDDCLGELDWTHPTPTDNCAVTQYNYTITNADGTQSGPFDLVALLNPNAPTGLFDAAYNFQLGTSTVAYHAEDGAGNTFDCSFTVGVTDDEAPAFVNCPTADTLTIGTDVDNCSANVIWAIPIAEDNCEVTVTQIAGPMPGDELAPGFYTVTYLAEDGADPANTDTCSFVLNIVDTQYPLILCPSNDVVVSTDADVCSWESPAGSLTPTIALANCPFNVTWAVFKGDTLQGTGTDDVSGYVFDLDTSIVCYYIEEADDPDSNGVLTDTCCFMVIVQDNEPPVITCPPNTTFQDTDDMAEDCQHTMGSTALDATATDNCSVISITHDYNSPDSTTLVGAIWPVGVTIITWTAVDTAGNISTCSFTVTVIDNVDPFIPCPADTNIVTSDGGLDDCLGELDWTHPTPTDNCGVTQYNYTITNADGTQSGPFDLVPLLNPNAPANLFAAAYNFQLGTSTVAYHAEDAAGNTFDCSFTVGVTDDEAPAFVNCPLADTLTLGTDVDNCSANVIWAIPIAEDNCEVTVTQIAGPMPGDELAPGFYTITYLAEDGADPANTDTCTFVLNIVDTQNPLILCPSNDVVVSTDDGVCSWESPAGSLTPTIAIANCPFNVTWAVFKGDTLQGSGTDDVSGYVFDLDTSIVCYYIEEADDPDSNGVLTDTCCFMVIVQDNEPPVITCPPNTTFQDTDDMAEDCQHLMGSTALDATATDNCSVISITHDYNSPDSTTLVGAIWPVGVTLITWTAVDTAGNISTCSFTVTVIDNVDPFIPCPADTNIVTSDGGLDDCLGELDWTHPTPTDNCGVTQYNYTITNADGTQSGPFDLVPLLNPNAPAGLFAAAYNFQLGTSTVEYHAEDAAGNTFDCSFTVGVTDDEAPAFVNCPTADTLTIGTDVDNCSANVIWAIPIAEDNCEVTVTQIAGPMPGDELAPGFYTVTYLAEDGADPANTDTCSFVLNIVDTQEPLIACPSNNVVASTDDGQCSWASPAQSLSPIVAIANCPFNITWAVFKNDTLQGSGTDDVSGYVFDLDTSIVCYYIEEADDPDSNGVLTDTCCFMVIVQDNEAPVITCPADITFLDSQDEVEDCQHTMGSTILDATATDNCSVVSITHDYDSPDSTTLVGAVWPVGVTIITWTAVDTAGNISTCSFTVTVEDDINPLVVCPPDAEITTSNNGSLGDCLGEYDWMHPEPTDNCGVTQYNYRIINSDGTIAGPFDLVPLLNDTVPDEMFEASYNFQLDTSTVEYYVEDAAGNVDTCTFTVVVTDDEAPEFLNCPTDTLNFANEVDQCGAYANYTPPIAEDNCDVEVTHEAGPAPSDFVAPGFYTVIYIATDPSGNTDTCEFVIRILDTQIPDVECPSNEVIVSADSATCEWISPTGSLTPISAFDNCAFVVTWEKTNPDGSVETGSDDVSGQTFALDTTMICYFIVEADDPDSNGILADTCCFIVIVEDNEAPSITCPPNTTFQDTDDMVEDCQHTMGSTALDATATDNCAIVSVTHDYNSPDSSTLVGAVWPVGVTTITWTAVDTAGNEVSCSFIVTVEDMVPPSITCPADTTISTSVGGVDECLGELEWTHASVSDNCNIAIFNVNYTNPDGTTEGPFDLLDPVTTMGDRQFAIGVSTVTYYVEDSTGNNNTCSFTVTVQDDEIPIFVNCPDTITAGNDPSQCGAFVNWSDPIAIDNCNDTLSAVQVSGPASGSFFDVGVFVNIVYEATDDEGNTVQCTFVVTVVDTEIPTAICKDTVIYLDANGMASITANDINGASSDNCGVDSLGASITDFTCADIGENNVLLTVIDAAGNIAACFSEVTVLDTLAPDFTCPPDTLISVCDEVVPDVITGLVGTDNCGGVTFTQNPVADILFVLPIGDTLIVVVTATDVNGNTSTCNVNVIISDETCTGNCVGDVIPPEWINCPRPPINVSSEPDMCEAFVNFSLPVALDNCELDTVLQIDSTGLTTGDMFPVGLTILSWLAVDTEGNISDTCTIKIFVNDQQPPQLLCPSDTTAINELGGCGAQIDGLGAIALDNCLVAVTFKVTDTDKFDISDAGGDDVSNIDFGCGIFEVTYMVSDQPIILISEATHELEAFEGGTNPVPPFIQTTDGDDFVEITNYGPATMDLSCLTIERIGGNNEVFVVPAGVVLAVGDVLTIHYGGGTDSPADHFFNIPGAADLDQGAPAGYVISIDTVALDVLAVNGFDPVGQATMSTIAFQDWTGGDIAMSEGGSAFRQWPWDSNNADDYAVSDLCDAATIGTLNPNSDLLDDIGITYSLQSLPPNKATCSFIVAIHDTELPRCGELNPMSFDGPGITVGPGEVVTSVIDVANDFQVGDVNILNLVGTHPEMSDLVFKLRSPQSSTLLLKGLCPGSADFNINLDNEATQNVISAPCGPLGGGGTYSPLGDLTEFTGDQSQGQWVLTIANANPNASVTLDGWTLELSEAIDYSQTDVILDNDPGECGANFMWTHPVVLDNCSIGEVFVEYTSEDGIEVPDGGEVVGGSDASEFFEVGTTTVTYTIVDKAGNEGSCSFTVTVLDVEPAVLVCPDDITINLGPGECAQGENIIPDIVGDNCLLDSVIIIPPSGTRFPIGTTEVTIIAIDGSGNSDTCTFNITVIEFIPTNNTMACNDLVNLSLDQTCMYVINADVILEGDDYGCFDDFCIIAIDENGDTIPDHTITSEHVGQTITVTVIDCEGDGSSCWGQIFVEDKLGPVVECPADITVACNESTDTSITGSPVVLNCEVATFVEYDDEVIDGDDCGDPRVEIFRTWFVTDDSGNASSCVQHIVVKPFEADSIEFPPHFINDTEFLCEDVSADPSLTEPENTGFPTINGKPIIGDHYCEINVGYWDEYLQDANCAGGYELLRNWIIRDECQPLEPGVNPIRYIQSINVKDHTPPEINAWVNSNTSSSSTECIGIVYLGASPEDLCTDASTVKWRVLFHDGGLTQIVAIGELPGDNIVQLPLGSSYDIVFIAEDACHNVATDTIPIDLLDVIPPVAICDEHTIVALTQDADIQNGLTKIAAEVFDDGSYDNCGDIDYKARRMTSCIDFDWTGPNGVPDGIVNGLDRGTSFGDYVPFACCDIGQEPVMVVFRVTDAEGNSNTCMVEVEVQDKLSPLLECPPDVVVSCEYWFDAQETNGFIDQSEDPLSNVFGRVLDAFEYDPTDRVPVVIFDPGRPNSPSNPDYLPQPYVWGIDGWTDDNCDVDVTVRVQIFDDCSGDNLPGSAPTVAEGVRLVRRTFLAKDGQGNSTTCVQDIWVVDFEPFYISDQTCVNADPRDGVIWPCDITYDTCPDSVTVDYPTIFDDNCSLIGVTYSDQRFEFVDGACYKILRTWEIIDWCHYNSQTGEGLWEYTQVIKVIDNDGPEFVVVSPFETGAVTFCALDSNVTLPDNNQVFLGEGNPLASSCSVHVVLEHQIVEMCSDVVKYDVKFYPNNGSDYLQVLKLTEAPVDSNGNANLTFDSRGSSILGVRLNGLPYNDRYCLPTGEKEYHRVLWSVEDGCGNSSTFEYLMRLEDCKAPSPVCVGLSSVVMPSSGSITIWAADFNASSFDDCTAAVDLLYSFSETEYEPSRVFDCQGIEDNGGPTFIVEIYAADEGNDLDCSGIITWDERNKDFCTTYIVIEDNEGVCPGDGSAGGVIETADLETVENVNVKLLDPSGSLMASFLTTGNGSYFFINPLLSYTVAPERNDNHTNGVSTLDLVQIQKHLLGLQRFDSPDKYIAADANNSEGVTALDLVEIRKLILGLYDEFPSNTSWRFIDADFEFEDENSPWPFDEVIELQGGVSLEENFIAVKVGDVNGTVSANASSIETREAEQTLDFVATDAVVLKGETVEVEVRSSNFTNILGYQFTLGTEGLVLKDVKTGAIDMGLENLAVHQRAVTASWNRVESVSVAEGEGLFTLVFEVGKDGTLSEMLSLNSRITNSEAYDDNEAIMDVALIFEEEIATVPELEFALYQNEPNPFNHSTTIAFTLPEAMSATLTIFDATGRVVENVEGDYAAGMNTIVIKRGDIGTVGMLYYRLDADGFTATKKMIIVQ